jgi:hypothetical protein
MCCCVGGPQRCILIVAGCLIGCGTSVIFPGSWVDHGETQTEMGIHPWHFCHTLSFQPSISKNHPGGEYFVPIAICSTEHIPLQQRAALHNDCWCGHGTAMVQNTLVPGHSQTKQLHRVDGTNTAMRRRLLLSDSLSTTIEYADIQLLRVASIPNILRPTSERSASLHGDNQATISFRTTDSIPCLLVLQRAHAGTSTHKFSRCVMTQLS